MAQSLFDKVVAAIAAGCDAEEWRQAPTPRDCRHGAQRLGLRAGQAASNGTAAGAARWSRAPPYDKPGGDGSDARPACRRRRRDRLAEPGGRACWPAALRPAALARRCLARTGGSCRRLRHGTPPRVAGTALRGRARALAPAAAQALRSVAGVGAGCDSLRGLAGRVERRALPASARSRINKPPSASGGRSSGRDRHPKGGDALAAPSSAAR
jgi:hypothetical protein